MELLNGGITKTRCDCCMNYSMPGDSFDAFFISWPAGFHAITGEPLIKYLYETIKPPIPRKYHSCPTCAETIREALRSGKISMLKDGRLKQDIVGVLAKVDNKFNAFQIHFLKQSRLGQA